MGRSWGGVWWWGCGWCQGWCSWRIRGFGGLGRKGGFGCGWVGVFVCWFGGGDSAGGIEAAWGLLLKGRGPLRHVVTASLADCCVFVF